MVLVPQLDPDTDPAALHPNLRVGLKDPDALVDMRGSWRANRVVLASH